MEPEYQLKILNGDWQTVSKEEFVEMERACGFRNTMGRQERPATAGFNAHGVSGRLVFPERQE